MLFGASIVLAAVKRYYKQKKFSTRPDLDSSSEPKKRFREDAAEEKVPVEKLTREELPVFLARIENRENSMMNTF